VSITVEKFKGADEVVAITTGGGLHGGDCVLHVFDSVAGLPCSAESWIIQLGNGPMWERPVAPDYQAFRDHFEKPQNFPAPNDVWVITTSYEPWNVILGSLIFCWPTTVVCGLLYHVFRGEKRDWVLHISLYIAIWLSASVGVCVVLWVIVGGWGPLAFDCFAVLGFIGGISSGLVTFRKATPNKTLDNPIQPPS
jgi:hypothetical protein